MWTNNIVTFYGADEDLKKVAEKLYSPGVTSEEDNCFDFNKIIPIPKELYYIHFSRFNLNKKMIHGREYKQWYYVNFDGKMIEQNPDNYFEKSRLKGMSSSMKKQFMRKYGALNDSDWIAINWGTRSNSNSVSSDEFREKLVYNFRTNYGSARLIVLEIESMIYRGEFPKVKMMWEHNNVDVHICFMEDDEYVPDPSPVFTVGFAETEKSTAEYYKW